MNFSFKIESVLIIITTVLCGILLYNIIRKLRYNLPYRVNCWFCNHNFWVKYPERNSWTCVNCDQYNGFTKDGDYNKPLLAAAEAVFKKPKSHQRMQPQNGLCKMCNINQQLKVTQLANFVPMNENNFNDEIESYRLQLEKAYKLCSPCKRVVQAKLHREKESLLDSKLLQSRISEKRNVAKNYENKFINRTIKSTSIIIAVTLMSLVVMEFFKITMKNQKCLNTITGGKEIIIGLCQRIFSIVETKAFMTFPTLEDHARYIYNIINIDYDTFLASAIKYFNSKSFDNANEVAQKTLSGFGCLLQIVGHLLNMNTLKLAIAFDLLWSIFVIMCILHNAFIIDYHFVCLLKLICTAIILIIFQKNKVKKLRSPTKVQQSSPKSMKSLIRGSVGSVDDDDCSSIETDDDVSLSKFGVNNYIDSSNGTTSPLNSSVISGRVFTPRKVDSLWNNSRLNSTFCVNSVSTKPQSVKSENVFVKPTFKNYQKMAKEDSDSDLDESISCLNIGSPKKRNSIGRSVFSLRKFTPTPSFVTPTVAPLSQSRPVISPSKLSLNTSWVAGGYWGSDGNREMFNVNGSRSSSQSSGFESQTSSNQRNFLSQPPSREESVCGELERTAISMDRLHANNNNFYQHSNSNNLYPQNFSQINSPVFPQMKYDNYVYIPQPRFNPTMQSHNVFVANNNYSQQRHQSGNNGMFKTPGGSGLIKLPQLNTFSPH